MPEEQEILEEPQAADSPEQDEGPGPKPVLSEDHRKKLDSIVGQMIVNKESEENIKKIIEDFKGKYAAAIPKMDFRTIPTQKAASESTSIPKNAPQKVLPGTTATQMAKAVEAAHDTLKNELSGNADLIPERIKSLKGQAAASQNLTNFAERPRTDQPLTGSQQTEQALMPPQQPVGVSPEEIQDFQQNLLTNQDAGRGFLHHIADKKTDKSKAIQAALYTADASTRVANDPEKAAKVLQNAHKIEKGDLVYGIQSGHLQKPEDPWQSIATGLQEKNKAFADYTLFSKASPEQAIQELEKRRSERDADEPTPVPANFISTLTGGMAEQPLKGLIAGKVAGGITGAIPGGQAFAGAADKFVTAAVSGNDFRKMSYANGLQKYYNQLRNEGMSEQEAYQKAQGQAKDESMVDAVSGAAMMYAGGKIGEMKLPSFNLSEGYKAALTTALKQGAKGIGEAGAIGLIQGAGQDVKNKLADMKGIKHDETGADIGHAMESGALFTLGMAAFAKGFSEMSGATKSKLAQYLSKAPAEEINKELGNQILEGHITPEEAQTAAKAIEEHRTLDQSIPENVSDEARAKIQDKIKRRRLLEIQMESADAAFHPELKEKIKAVNEDILELSKDKKPKGEVDDLAVEPEISQAPVPEPEQATETGIAQGDTVISKHFEGPQTVRNVSKDGKSIYIEGPDHHVHEVPIEDITLKVKQNASTIRGDQGQVPEGGNAPEGGQNESGQNLQPPEVNASINGETIQPPEEGGVNKPPVDMGDLPFTPESGDVTRLAHKNTEELYEDLNTSGRIPRETKEDTKLESEANDLIKSGYDFDGKATKVLDTEERLSDTEQVAFSKMVGALKVKLNNLDINSPEFDAVQNRIELLSRASDKSGSEAGAALRARRMFVLNDQTLSDYIKREKESMGVDELTPEQKERAKKEFDDIQTKQKEYDKKIEDLEKENAKLRAENEIKKTASGIKKGVKKSHDDYVKDRKSILEQMRADLLKAAKGEGGLAASIPGSAQLAAIAPHVAKLVKSLVEEGVDKLEDVVKSIHGDLKDILEGISEKDVHDIIAGEYNEKKYSKGDLAAKMRDLKDEAGLINKLERLQNGEEPKNEKSKIARNKQITNLKKQIADIQKEQRKADKEGNTFYTEPKEIDRVKLESIKSRNQTETKKVNEAIAKGDFEKPEKKTPILENEEVKKKYPNLFKDVVQSADKLIAAKKDRELRLAKQQYENRKPWEKTWDSVKQILGLRRAINTAFDFSVPFRQASRVTMNPLRAKTTARAFSTMFSHTFSPKAFDRWFFELEQSPDYLNMQKDKLYISSPDELRISKREEIFQTDLAAKIPLLKEPFNASQRAASAYLNQMRVDLYRSGAKLLSDKGVDRNKNPEAYESLANLANNLTGRGNLLSWLEGKPANALSQVFYGPRLMASKFNLLNPVFYAKLPKPIRRRALLDLAGYAGFYVTAGTLASAAGASVSLDPNDPDFLKIKVGDTKYDITGGEGVYVRTALRVLAAANDRINGTQEEQDKSVKKASNSVLSFFRNKLAPNTSFALNAFLGKNSVGQPFNPTEALKYYPMWIDDIVDDYKQHGPASILVAGVPSIFGIGVQTYVPKDAGGSGGGSGAGGSYKITPWK